MKKSRKGNRLENSSSPYLKVHSTNPVDWYPWGEEALSKAKIEDKPILLSIGYLACHWCHVMARESFEDEETAELMNRLYVNIKVDREERPDIDEYFQTIARIMGVQGGWPLTVFLTPDLEPIYIGTYFPKERRFNLPSFRELLVAIHDSYVNLRDKIKDNSRLIKRAVEQSFSQAEGDLNTAILKNSHEELIKYYDSEYSGFGSAPKFPVAPVLSFLQEYYFRTKFRPDILLNILDTMWKGGIYDHVGGGFHRYSVDRKWEIPHFEKMLYDNALLSRIYLESSMIFGVDRFKATGIEILEYILRDLSSPRGGFYSSQGADSGGIEGAYYVWDEREMNELLGDESEILKYAFGVSEEGNFHGKNVLVRKASIGELADKFDMSAEEVEEVIERGKKTMLEFRNSREPPDLDDKIITSWNAMTVEALISGFKVSQEKVYLDSAGKNLEFLISNLIEEERLFHCWCDGDTTRVSMLEDYAHFIKSLIEYHHVTGKTRFLELAESLTEKALETFHDGDRFVTSEEFEISPIYDSATPSPVFTMVENLIILSIISDAEEWMNIAEKTLRKHAGGIPANPIGFATAGKALITYITPVVVKSSDKSAVSLARTIPEVRVAIEGDYSQTQLCTRGRCIIVKPDELRSKIKEVSGIEIARSQ